MFKSTGLILSLRPAILVPNADVDGGDVMNEDVGVGEERAARWLPKDVEGDGDDATQDTLQIPSKDSLMAMLKPNRANEC